MIRVVIVGGGSHMCDKLLPALIHLQNDKLINIVAMCRKNVCKGSAGLDVPVIDRLDMAPDFDALVVSGPPDLHNAMLQYAEKNNKACFVEKPHLIENDMSLKSNRSMIGYNFNFIPGIDDLDIENIICETNGVYMSWGDIFPHNSVYMNAIHTVLVHPLSILIKKYGTPESLHVKINQDTANATSFEMILSLQYDKIRTIIFSTKGDRFKLDIYGNGEIIECKKYKQATYYQMLQYFFRNIDFVSINNLKLGNDVLNTIDMIKKYFPAE